MPNAFLKPSLQADGKTPLLVRDPQTLKPLNAAGEWKELSPYWQRRLRDKDVTDATATATTPQPTAPAPAPSEAPVAARPAPPVLQKPA